MKRSFSRIVLLILTLIATAVVQAHAQSHWDTYLARYEGGPGSVVVNMEADRTAPRRDLPFLLITAVTFQNCQGDGFPVLRELRQLNRLSDKVNRKLFALTSSARASALPVGTFTHQCQRLEYIYLADTVGLRKALQPFAPGRKYARFNFQIRVTEDPEWDVYRRFLYPNEAVRIFMKNEQAINRMMDAGDPLSAPRFVEHLIYFDAITDREMFIRYIGRMKYDIKEERDMHRDSLRYQVRLAKFGTVSLEKVNDQTTYLSEKAREFSGVYNGWETKLIESKQRFRLLYNPIAEAINPAK